MNSFSYRISREATPQSSSQGGTQPVNEGASYGARYQWANRPDTALAVSAYYRAVDIISSSIAVMPINYMCRKGCNSPFVVATNPRGRNLNYLFNVRPNSRQNAFQFKKQAVVNVLNHGNAYIYPVKSMDGEIQELILLSAEASVTDIPSMGIVSFYDAKNNIAKDNVPYSDMIILRSSFLNHEGRGVSVISYAKQTLTTAATFGAENMKRVANGGRLKGIIRNANAGTRGIGQYTNGQLKKQRNELQEQLDAGNDILVLGGDSQFTPNQMSYADLQWIDSYGVTCEDIARFTGCPLALLMRNGNSNYKTLADSTNEFMSRCLLPYVRNWECELSSTLIMREYADRQSIMFDTRSLFALDMSAMAAWNKSRLECGIVCPNELRVENNLEPIEGGDAHYVNASLAVIGSDKLMGYGGGRPSGDIESDVQQLKDKEEKSDD